MEEGYNRFRFRHRELFKKYGDRSVREVFADVWFFVYESGLDEFRYGDIIFFANLAMHGRGQLIIDVEKLAMPIIDFILAGSDLVETPYNLYDDIYRVVSGVLKDYMRTPEKFAEPLSRRIAEEFRTGEISLTMDQVASKLKEVPEFRFLPLQILEKTMDSVYDYFMEKDSQ